MSVKVFLTESIDSEAQALLAQHVELDVGDFDLTPSELHQRVAQVDVIFSKTDPILINESLMDAAPSLKLIARHGSGYSNVTLDYATRKGIAVTNTPGVNAVTMAEYTIGLMFAAARQIVSAANACYKGTPDRLSFLGTELHGKTFGIVGVGEIGKQVVTRVHALGMNVLAYHPRPSARTLTNFPLKLVDIDELLRESRCRFTTCAANRSNPQLIGPREIKLMKSTAILLNLSRGGVVDETALFNALDKKIISAAATDVLAHEPVRSCEPLLSLDNCLVLPHIAAVTKEAQKAVAMAAVEEILRYKQGKPLQNIVNPDALKMLGGENG